MPSEWRVRLDPGFDKWIERFAPGLPERREVEEWAFGVVEGGPHGTFAIPGELLQVERGVLVNIYYYALYREPDEAHLCWVKAIYPAGFLPDEQ